MALVVLSGKVTPEVHEQFKAAQEASEAMTHNAFLEMLLEAYLNPKVKNVEVPRATAEQLQEIQLKDNEIGRLHADNDFKKQEIEAMAEECRLLTKQILEQQPATEGTAPELAEGQEILTIPPIMQIVIDKEAATAARKSGKQWSRGDVLLNMFWEAITQGAAHPFVIWSSSEIEKLKKQLQ